MFWYVLIGIAIGCFGAFLMFKTSGNEDKEVVGSFIVDVSDNDTDIYRVEFDAPLYSIENFEYVKFKVKVIR